jgi:putative SOS response-associated peptidase YedK
MCNETRRRIALGQIREDWGQTRIPLRFPEGLPNLAPLDSVRITDPNPIIRAAAPPSSPPGLPGGAPSSSPPGLPGGVGGGPFEAELVVRRWSWPGPAGKPVYNYRSEGRDFRQGRCLIVADGFYEFTAPPPPADGAAKAKRKDKWLFTKAGEDWFCIAGLWRADPQVGEAFTMLTVEPGPDVAPYHSRQIVVLEPRDWVRWLDPAVPAAELLKPLAPGSLNVAPASR